MKIQPRHRSKTYFEPSTVLLLRQIGVGFVVLSLVSLVVALVWFGTRLTTFTVATIDVVGGITISHDEIKSKTEAELLGTYQGIIPKRFTLFYPELKIKTALESVGRIKDVVVKREGTKIKVTFNEYVPEALWCSLLENQKCLFLDETGFAFSLAPDLHGGGMVRYFSTEREPKEKETPFDLVDYNATKKFALLLEDLGWYVSKVEINQTKDVFYSLSQGGELKATLVDSPEKPFENLRTILNSKEFSHLTPGNFQYLDLRFGTRVFVNEVLIPEGGLSTTTASTTAVAESE